MRKPLVSLAAGVVHHGGIGTGAYAIAADMPQLILPFAWVRIDNAVRVKKLGAGGCLKLEKSRSNAVACALADLLWPESTAAAQTAARRFNGQSGMASAADHTETQVIRS